MRVTQRVKSVATKTGKSTSTVWRWVKAGCDISSAASINQFLKGNHRKRNGPRHHNPNTSRKPTTESVETGSKLVDEPAPDLDQIELAPVGRRGAAAALQRLEEIEERAHARLMRAIEAGNPFQVKGGTGILSAGE